jgi:apolipoprotein N-acyltransferase
VASAWADPSVAGAPRAGSGLAFTAAAASGVLLCLSFPKFGYAAVAWIALLPLLAALVFRRGRAATRLGYVSGVVSSVGLLYWTAIVVAHFGGLSIGLATGAMLLLCLVLGVFTALFAATLGLWLRAFGHWAALCAPLAWVAMELLRRQLLYGFAWCLLGYSQAEVLPLVQVAALAGVYGVSFVVVLAPSVTVFALFEPAARRRWLAVAGGLTVLAGAWVYGALRLRAPIASLGSVRVGVIQASIPQDEKWQEGLAWRNVERHLALSREAARRGATLVVWPESAVPDYFDSTPLVAAALRQFARDQNVYLLFGNDDREDEGEERVWVGAKLLAPDGRLTLRYHKMELVPFGEYVPLQGLFGILGVRKLVEQAGSYIPGTEATVGSVDSARVGVTICYEAIFPDLVRHFTLNGANLLANVTNDGWYGSTSAPYQHFAMARLRSVENGRSFVRAANTGISALIDPRGRVLGRTVLFERRTLVGDVPLTGETTFYSRHGDVFAWTCLAASLLVTTLALARYRAGSLPDRQG